MGIRHGMMIGFVLAIAVSPGAQARDFAMGGDRNFPYSIMAPERGSVPRRRGKASFKKRHITVQHPRAYARKAPRGNLSVVRGSSGSVLPTPLPRTEIIPPEGSRRLALPASPQQQGPSIIPGVANPVPNLPHGPETFQDRASRCAFQRGLYNVPGNMSTQYMGTCLQ